MLLLHLNVLEPQVVQVEWCHSPQLPCQQALHLCLASEKACEVSCSLYLDDCAVSRIEADDTKSRAFQVVYLQGCDDCNDYIVFTDFHECPQSLVQIHEA